jgi:dipeptidyl aminopeptidase/acylaminoacyl peptidase
MRPDQERLVRSWLESRDPGDAPAQLRAAVADVPFAERGPRFPALAGPPIRLPWLHISLRPVLLVLLVIAAVVAALSAGYLVLRPPFPPRGLLAYIAPIAATGSTGISLSAADGSEARQLSPTQANLYDHSPRWSRDGRTLLFARTTGLDAFGSCGGVGSVVLYDVATGTEHVVATGLRPMNDIEWSPGEDRAAYVYPPPGCGTEVELGVVDLRTGAVTTTIVVPQPSEISPTSPTGVLWHVQWVGEVASAVPDATVTDNGRDFTTTADLPSHDGHASIRYAWTTPERVPTLKAINRATGTSIELGPGGVPAWSPDDTAIAYIQPGGSAGPKAVEFMRDHLVIATDGTWQTRVVADVLVMDGSPADVIPALSWTPDGAAVYWIDGSGVHVIDVATGRSADLANLPNACADLQWQPIPR